MATDWFDNFQFMLDFRFSKTMSRTTPTVCGMFSHITRADQNHPVVESNQRKHNIRHVKKESSNLMKIGLGTKMNARILGIWANWNRQQRFQKSPFMQSLESIIQTHSRYFWHPRSLDWSILSRDPGRQVLSSPKCKFISGWRAKNIFNALPPPSIDLTDSFLHLLREQGRSLKERHRRWWRWRPRSSGSTSSSPTAGPRRRTSWKWWWGARIWGFHICGHDHHDDWTTAHPHHPLRS